MRGSGVHRPAGHPTLCDPSLPPSGCRGLEAGLVLQPPPQKKPAQVTGEVGPQHPGRPRAWVLPQRAPRRLLPAQGRAGLALSSVTAAVLQRMGTGSARLPPQRLRGERAGLATLSHHPVVLYPGQDAPPGNHEPGLPRECRPRGCSGLLTPIFRNTKENRSLSSASR